MKSSVRSLVFGIVLMASTAIGTIDSSRANQYPVDYGGKAAEFNRINHIDSKALFFVSGWSKLLYTSPERPIDNGRCLILKTIGQSEIVLNPKPESPGESLYIIKLEKINEKIAREMWGGRSNEDGGVTCDLITQLGNSEMDIFHLDMKFVEDRLSSYRLRGIGIQKPQWVNISREAQER